MMVLSAALNPDFLFGVTGAICRADGAGMDMPVENIPSAPSNSDASKCPICPGVVSASAILGEPIDFLTVREPVSERIFIIGEQVAERIGAGPPRSRAPPALV